MRKGRYKHGGKGTRLYRIWKGMRARSNPACATYFPRHAGRGIASCAEWSSFTAFRDWSLLNGYSDELMIDRRDNDGNYTPENCRWVSRSVNGLNSIRAKRNADSEALVISDVFFGLSYTQIAKARGMSKATVYRIVRDLKKRPTQ